MFSNDDWQSDICDKCQECFGMCLCYNRPHKLRVLERQYIDIFLKNNPHLNINHLTLDPSIARLFQKSFQGWLEENYRGLLR